MPSCPCGVSFSHNSKSYINHIYSHVIGHFYCPGCDSTMQLNVKSVIQHKCHPSPHAMKSSNSGCTGVIKHLYVKSSTEVYVQLLPIIREVIRNDRSLPAKFDRMSSFPLSSLTVVFVSFPLNVPIFF